MRKINVFFVTMVVATWIGCAPGIGRDDNAFKSSVYPVFDPLNSVIPLPNDLLLSTDTGKVELPTDGMSASMKEFTEKYLNTLDGFMADQPISVNFSGDIDAKSLSEKTVLLLDITDNTQPVTGLQFQFVDSSKVLIINHPYLKSGHKYVAILTTDIKDKAGKAISSSMIFNFLKSTSPLVHNNQSLLPGVGLDTATQLEGIRKQMAPLFEALANKDLPREKIGIMWTFTVTTSARIVFDPEKSLIPLPNDLLMDPKTGKLSFPLPEGADCSKPAGFKDLAEKDRVRAYFFCFMNSMDGFSVTSTPQMSFEKPVDKTSLTGSVDFYTISDTGLQPVTNYTVDCSDTKCTGLTIHAGMLQPGQQYLVVATKLLAGEGQYDLVPSPAMALMMLTTPLYKDGHSTLPDVLNDEQAAQLEPLRLMYQPLLDNLATTTDRKSIVGFFTFTTTSSSEVIFDPTTGNIPFPNDFLVNPITGKMALPIPSDESDAIKGTLQQINNLDGFSTYTPIQVSFSRPLDLKSITLADSIVGVLTSNTSIVDLGDAKEVQTNPPDASALLSMNVKGTDDIAISQQGSMLIMSPKSGHQYLPGHEYVLGLKNGLVSSDKDADNKPYPVIPAAISVLLRSPYPLTVKGKNCLPEVMADKDVAQLELARKMFFAPLFDALATANVKRDDISLLVLFRTLNAANTLKPLVDKLLDTAHAPTEGTTNLIKPGDSKFDAFFGTNPSGNVAAACINCSFKGYLRLKAPDLTDPTNPVFGKFDTKFRDAEFKYDFILPKGAGPFKVLLFQHGLGGTKADVAKWADELAENGIAVIAIDAPFHGEHPIHIDSKGTGFFSTDVFAVSDNFREAALDQVQAINFALTVLPGILTGEGYTNVLDTSKAYYAGISLGGIIGGITSSIDPSIDKSAIIVGAGHMTRILMDTANEGFKQPLLDALAGMGIKEGTPEWDQFFMLAQWGLDQGDPINFLARPVDGIPMDYSHRYFVVEARNDGFIPNTATDEMLTSMGLVASKPPVSTMYPKDSQDDLCHPFFIDGCDPTKYPNFQTAVDQAHKDVLDFLNN